MGFGVDTKFHLMPIAKLPIDIALFRISNVYQVSMFHLLPIT